MTDDQIILMLHELLAIMEQKRGITALEAGRRVAALLDIAVGERWQPEGDPHGLP